MSSDIEMERAIIGGIIADGICCTLADESFTNLVDLDFTDRAVMQTFAVLVGMYQEKKAINPVSVAYELERAGVGDRDTVQKFMDASTYPEHACEYVKIVKRNGLLRTIRHRLTTISPEASTQDIENLMELINRRDQTGKRASVLPREYMDGYIESIFNPKTVKINTGFGILDESLHAQPGDLIVIGARTGVGKTTFLTNVLLTMLRDEVTCLYCPTEMKPAQFTSRLIPIMTGVWASRFRSLNFEVGQKAKIESAAESINGMPLSILDIASPTIGEIRAEVKAREPRVLFVDYLGRCSMTREATRMREIERFVVSLKNLCVERRIICFLAVQLGRATDYNVDAPPLLADLADSSAIEKEADLVLMLWKDKNRNNGAGPADKSIISALIAKNRHGLIRSFDIEFNKSQMRMSEFSCAPTFGASKVDDTG